MKRILVIAAAAALLMGCTGKENNPILTVEGGQIQGVKADIEGVYVYRGIPYAAAPIGDLRWKAPQPVKPWEGVFIADEFGHPSYQAVHYPGNYFTEWGYGEEKQCSEDCLYLNVWTKYPGQVDKKAAVAVWIHGGGYREGWGSEPEFDAQEWAAKDVVLVSINYRLGVFGFLTHPELSAESENGVSGNYGVLDMIQSLKWVKENIEQFGGDPDNVMIFGQSAGGGAVRTLCESPLAKPYFHKAVIMSAGGMTVPNPAAPAMPAMAGRMGAMRMGPMTLENAEQQVKKIMDWAGLTDLAKMRRAATETIHAVGTIYNGASGEFGYITGSPIVDGYVSLKSFDDAAKEGTLADIPYMIGYTMNDMGNMSAGIAAFCQNREEKGGKAWAYEFARPLPDDGSHPEDLLKGAFHSSDLWFVFKSLQHCWRPWAQGDWDLSEKMLTAWTNFAKYSDPNGPDGGVWTPCTAENPDFMLFKLDENDAENSEMGQPIQ
ncbi:MAG: carboxylesterase family protein [Bacteroidales bacterium]|nr:carboxylesterase family protein [Bacteroidales bacterium]